MTAIGPYLSQAFSKAFRVTVKYQREFNAENRPRGDRFWLQTLLPF
ncbi:MAG: transporter [Elusimicrobia bacterium]|nr:transporter [Elusimicrobiota bacterium]